MNALPLLALPGLLNDARLWQHQVAALSAERTVAIGDLTQADSVAELARAVLAKAPAGRFALAGLSMGGYVAQEIVRQAPERVAALALLDTSARPDTEQAQANRRALLARSAAGEFAAVVAGLTPRLLHPEHLADQALVALLEDMGRAVGPQAFERQQTAIMGRPDSRPSLAQIRCPTVVVCGREDQLTPLELAQEMASGIAGAELVVVERSGHMSPLEQPQAVTAALRAWLARVPA